MKFPTTSCTQLKETHFADVLIFNNLPQSNQPRVDQSFVGVSVSCWRQNVCDAATTKSSESIFRALEWNVSFNSATNETHESCFARCRTLWCICNTNKCPKATIYTRIYTPRLTEWEHILISVRNDVNKHLFVKGNDIKVRTRWICVIWI